MTSKDTSTELNPATSTEPPKRTLSQREQRALEKLTRSEFETVRSELQAQHDSWLQAEYERLDAETAALREVAKDPKWEKKIDKIGEKFLKALTALEEEMAQEGVEFAVNAKPGITVWPNRFSQKQQVVPKGLEVAKQTARERARRALYAALRQVDEQQRQFERKIMLAVIGSVDGLDLVKAVPTSEQIFAGALETKATA